MQRDLTWLNSLTDDEATKELLQCCGSKRWASATATGRPYDSLEILLATADDIWWSLNPNDWIEAFRSHPKIGEKKAADKVSAQSQQWSGQEQSGVAIGFEQFQTMRWVVDIERENLPTEMRGETGKPYKKRHIACGYSSGDADQHHCGRVERDQHRLGALSE